VYQNPFLYSAVLRAFDEDFAVTHLEEAFGTILHTAPEFPTSLAQDEKFEASKISVDLGQALRTKLKGGGTPMFARGALYQWALLSVAGVLDSLDPSKILPGKSFSLDDGWTGHVKLTPSRTQLLKK
jgi:hypothetical protein